MLTGVDPGGTKISVAAAERPDRLLASARVATPGHGAAEVSEILRPRTG